MQSELNMKLQPRKTSINKIEHGFDALGYVIRPHSRYLRRSTVRNGMQKIEGLTRSKADFETVRHISHSYFGIFDHADAWKLQRVLARKLCGAGYVNAVPSTINESTLTL